jgi:hypothetical protein
MPDVVKHAWTHRPRAQGGTDPISVAGAFPAVVCSGGAQTIPELDNWSLTILDGGSFGSYTGMMNTITLANNASGPWGMAGTDTRLTIDPGYWLIQFEAGINVEGEYAGDIDLIVTGQALSDDSPITNVHTVSMDDTNVSSLAHTYVEVRGAGLVVTNPVTTAFFTVYVLQETGGDIDITQSWCYLTAMPLENLQTFTSS